MDVKFLNPFVEAAYGVILAETGFEMARGELYLDKESYIADDVTVIVSLVGEVEGNVFYSMPLKTALTLASQILGESICEFDGLAQSGIAELGNVITGSASVKLSAAGYQATISPPALLQGKGAILSTLDYARLVVPLQGNCGPLAIHLALREGRNHNFNIIQTRVAKNTYTNPTP